MNADMISVSAGKSGESVSICIVNLKSMRQSTYDRYETGRKGLELKTSDSRNRCNKSHDICTVTVHVRGEDSGWTGHSWDGGCGASFGGGQTMCHDWREENLAVQLDVRSERLGSWRC